MSCTFKSKNLDNQIQNDFREYIKKIDNRELNQKAEDLFIDAMVLQQQEKWAESLIDLNLALEQDSSAGIYYSIARAYAKLQRYKLAVDAMKKSIKLNPNFLPSLEMIVEMYMQEDDVEEAITIYKKILEIDNSFFNRLNYANLVEDQRPLESIPLYEDLLKEDSKNEKLILKLLKLYKISNNNEKYTGLLEKLHSMKSTNSNIGLDLLDLYLNNKEYENALNLLNRADTTIATNDLKMFYGTMGYRLLYDSSMNDKQIINKYLNKIDTRFYFDWELYLQSGYIASKIGNDSLSSELFSKALKFCDTIPDIYVSIGLYYLQHLKDSIALTYFQDGGKRFTDDYRFPFFKGIAYQSLKKYEEAISCFKQTIEIDSLFIESWVQLGAVYDLSKQPDSSDYYYEKALQLDPLNPLVNNNYAYSLSLRGIRMNDAEKMSRTALSIEPDNAAYIDTFAWINFLIGKFDIALEHIEKAVKSGSASSEVYEHYGDILLKLNKKEEAIKAYRNSLKIQPDRQSVIDRLNKIERK